MSYKSEVVVVGQLRGKFVLDVNRVGKSAKLSVMKGKVSMGAEQGGPASYHLPLEIFHGYHGSRFQNKLINMYI